MFFVLLLLISALLRLPLWMRPDGLNSDHAVSALQGLHMLRGEFSWFLWGVGYQASLEPLINAFFFRLLGENSYAVLATSYSAYLISLWAIYAILRRQLPPAKAALAALFVVVVTPPLFIGTFYPPRPWCLTSIFVGLYAADRGWFGWAAFLAFFSLYVDFFAIQFLPALLAFSAARAWLTPERKRALTRFGVGLLLGALVLGLSRKLGPTGSTHLAIKFNHFWSNLRLMIEGMLPMIYGFPTRFAFQEIPLPEWFRNPLWLVTRTLAAAIPLGAFAWSAREFKVWDRDTKLWVAFGLALCGTSLFGTVFSQDVYDVYAYRYLTPLTWALPFLLLPTIKKLEVRRAASLFLPYFLVVLLTNQLYYGSPSAFGTGANERALGELLAREKVAHGYSNYWPSYRITYLLREAVIVVPLEKQANRYEPYRIAVEAAPRYALIYTAAEEAPAIPNATHFRVPGYHGYLIERSSSPGFLPR